METCEIIFDCTCVPLSALIHWYAESLSKNRTNATPLLRWVTLSFTTVTLQQQQQQQNQITSTAVPCRNELDIFFFFFLS